MRNANSNTINRIKAGDKRLEAAKKGWNDARQGIPYDAKYADSLPQMEIAAAYENWRLRAIDAIKYGIKTPVWNTDNGIPPKVLACRDAAWIRAIESGKPPAPLTKKYIDFFANK